VRGPGRLPARASDGIFPAWWGLSTPASLMLTNNKAMSCGDRGAEAGAASVPERGPNRSRERLA